MPTDRTVDWEHIKRCLLVLHREARPFLGRALLIGGAACWFYRRQLQSAADPDFPLPTLAPVTEAQWLSKDIDFTGVFSADALALLPQHVVTDAAGRSHIEVAGVRLGFAQVGVTLDPEAALATATIGEFSLDGERVQFLVADPVSLYREKQALHERRNAPQDFLHLGLLRECLVWRVVVEAEKLLSAVPVTVSEQRAGAELLAAAASKAPEVLRDPRIARRVGPRLRAGDFASAAVAKQLGLSLASAPPNG